MKHSIITNIPERGWYSWVCDCDCISTFTPSSFWITSSRSLTCDDEVELDDRAFSSNGATEFESVSFSFRKVLGTIKLTIYLQLEINKEERGMTYLIKSEVFAEHYSDVNLTPTLLPHLNFSSCYWEKECMTFWKDRYFLVLKGSNDSHCLRMEVMLGWIWLS